MTGLDVDNDTILQIACFVTDYDLNLLDPDGLETQFCRLGINYDT